MELMYAWMGNKMSMHHKVIVIDGQIVVMGSYNFSKSTKTLNDENSPILHRRNIAKQFVQEFERIRTKALDQSA